MIGFLSRWCVTQGYLPKGSDLLEGVQKFSKAIDGEPEILTPEEMAKLLAHVSDELLSFIVLCGFAGLRSIEVQRLDWSQIKFEGNRLPARRQFILKRHPTRVKLSNG